MYELVIANKRYSSWSMRVWIAMKAFNLPFEEIMIRFDDPIFSHKLKDYSLRKQVPILKHGKLIIPDSLAILLYLAEQHPELHLWPKESVAKAKAISLCAQMHSGFPNLRRYCPMRAHLKDLPFTPNQSVLDDTQLLQAILEATLSQSQGPFLFGDYSIADAYFAPMLSRFESYGLPLSKNIQHYFNELKMTPSYQSWQSEALHEVEDEFVLSNLSNA